MRKFLKILIGLIIISIPIGLLFLRNADCKNQDNLINRLQCKLVDKNSINVLGLQENTNDIEIRLYSGNLIYKNGKKAASIPREYGNIDFLIYLNERLIGQAGIYNHNWWQTHDFIFEFSPQNNDKFNFKVNGPDAETLYFKSIVFDSINRIQTEIFYNNLGLTGQINKNYFNQSNQLVADEVWVNDTLITMNLYDKGEFSKNYTVQKYDKDTKYTLGKIDTIGFLAYDLTTIKPDTILKERIIIKN
ncbi:MAG TPA: hypothetical protein PLF32_09320 [Bacteroidales bacterium]|nr:hypothetical protein [Bacteroidales bacterium]HOR82839.1 hypothetical protein [Bacteroidales bacterium]